MRAGPMAQPTPAALQQRVLTVAGLHTCCLQAPTTHPTQPLSRSRRSSRSQAAGAVEQHASQHSQHPRQHPLLLQQLQQLQQALALWKRCARLCRLVCYLVSAAARIQAAVAAARTDTCVPCVCLCCRAILQNGGKVSQPMRSMCPGLWMSSKLQVGAGSLGRVDLGRCHFGMLQAYCGSCWCCSHCCALCVFCRLFACSYCG